MTIMEKMAEIAGAIDNHYLKEARLAGKRVIGYFCSYIPVELIHAAGFVPYRMRAVGSAGTDLADAYYAPLNCSFVRHCFDRALRGDFGFLDGVVFMNGCDHTRRMYDNWRYSKTGPEFLHMFFAPHVMGGNAAGAFRESMANLKKALEKSFGVTIADDNLRNSIRLYNRMRGLLLALDERRKMKSPPVSGSEMLGIVMAVTAVPVEDACALLEEVIAFIDGRGDSHSGDVRIIMLAGCMEEADHLRLYEDSGGVIVSDAFCFGTRLYGRALDENIDPAVALAAGYLGSEISCPRMMDDFPRRIEWVARKAGEYSADAVVVEKLKFCDMWGWEIERLRRESKKGVIPPVLAIEREYLGGASGQVRTRIQAFFEQIRNRQEIDDAILRSERAAYYVRK
ncbi:MAG TPA: 2-hydroxyacyl-CoA dehydratase family protein [Spirochaetota bacterium]|nr:2-hydroxyacyl-CoA dehydratase family protein [Spirochaetota bacterium]HRZ25521.1 2-hydroxyacyl-CoA dehydratase family protein [Spirochaetota bacterium]HSA13709.1 2-hydroxyacyl-CoA dehydratase family protein [Spirochaetota bacterium]